MNWFASFAVFLTITQALVPTTGKTPDNGARNGHTQNRRADTSKNPAAPRVSPHAKDGDGPALKPDTNKDAADLNQPAINITNPTSVPVAWGGREWTIWGANLALAVVGIGGIVVAIVTLCFIKRQAVEMCRQRITMEKTLNAIRQQANHMERQTGILEKSVAAAQASVDGMISKERARIRVEMTGVELDKGAANVTFTVTCFGPTSAFVTDAWGTAMTSPADVPLTMDLKYPMSLPPVLREQEIKKSAYIMNKLKFETSDIEDFHKQRLYVHICGVISYKDVFDRVRTTTFRYVCKTTDYVRPDGTISKYWFKSGPEEDNSET